MRTCEDCGKQILRVYPWPRCLACELRRPPSRCYRCGDTLKDCECIFERPTDKVAG